jgi:hypothetical protein
MNLSSYLGLLGKAEQTLAESFRQVADGHGHEPDVHFLCLSLAKQCDDHESSLAPAIQRFGEGGADDEPERLHAAGIETTRSGPLGLLRDLQDLYMLANFVDCTWTMVGQAAQAIRDDELQETVGRCESETSVQIAWLKTRMKQAAPQALIAA